MKPGKSFNLSKSTKRMMCTIIDTVERNIFKKAMITAEIIAATPTKSREPREQRTENKTSSTNRQE